MNGREEKDREGVKEEEEEEKQRSFFTGPFWNGSNSLKIKCL